MKIQGSSGNINFKYAKGKTDIYGRLFHDYYEIFLMTNGSVEFTNSHTKRILSPFQIVLIPPGEYHQFTVTENKENYERFVIDIYPGLTNQGILTHAFDGKEILTLTKSDRIVEHFFYLKDCLENGNREDFPYILDSIATDMVFLIKNIDNAAETSVENFSKLSLIVIDYIDKHFTEDIDLGMLSRKFFCSVSTLCHIFKKEFGISIKKYIIQKRLNAAKMALQQGAKAEEVCMHYGFLNYSSFYRHYKNHFGISPSETNCQNLNPNP